MMLLTDLLSFAYVPGWYNQLDELAKLALPEPWCFRKSQPFAHSLPGSCAASCARAAGGGAASCMRCCVGVRAAPVSLGRGVRAQAGCRTRPRSPRAMDAVSRAAWQRRPPMRPWRVGGAGRRLPPIARTITPTSSGCPSAFPLRGRR